MQRYSKLVRRRWYELHLYESLKGSAAELIFEMDSVAARAVLNHYSDFFLFRMKSKGPIFIGSWTADGSSFPALYEYLQHTRYVHTTQFVLALCCEYIGDDKLAELFAEDPLLGMKQRKLRIERL